MASANSAPPRWFGDTGGLVFPGSTDTIAVVREELRFDLTDDLGSAQVTARYDLGNQGGDLKEFPVIFVLQDANGHREEPPVVTLNGKPVASALLSTEKLTAEQQDLMAKAWSASDQVVDPVTGERYSTKDFFGKPEVQYTQFALDLTGGAAGMLEVSYRHHPASDKNRSIHPIYHYQYLLLPAKGWAAFGPLELRVKAPAPDQAYFASTLPMQYQDGEYRASFSGLPDQNLAFSLMSRKGIIAGWTEPGPYFWLAFVLVLLLSVPVGIALGWWPGAIRSRGWAIAAGVAAGMVLGSMIDMLLAFLVIAASPALSDQSYGLAFVGVGQGALAMIITTVAAGITAGRRNRKRSLTLPQ
jgi:hypothetical protein